ncbi:hypothetical protein SDC9_62250 [bioreactor metagenome]|uniref:Uncharacterized protein n=1 Tax=bioreactor metagenome TaxID=1076179 RepID=A0A644XI29_9ZZZZ
MRLIDDHRGVLRQHRPLLHGVDGQQGMVGHHQIGGPGPLPGLLHEALRAERAALRAQAFPRRDRHLRPAPGGVGRGLVPIRQPVPLGLLLGPLAQGQHLGPQHGHLIGPGLTDLIGDVGATEQALLLHRPVLPDPQQAGVVRPPLQDGRPYPLAGHLLHRREGVGDVAVGELCLQGQGRRRDHDPVVGVRSEVRQHRREVAQGLAGAGPGLHQQVLAPVQGPGDRLRHRLLPRAGAAADHADGGLEEVVSGHRGQLLGRHPSTLDAPLAPAGRRAGRSPRRWVTDAGGVRHRGTPSPGHRRDSLLQVGPELPRQVGMDQRDDPGALGGELLCDELPVLVHLVEQVAA